MVIARKKSALYIDLGPIGTVLYWMTLIGWSFAFAYLVLFKVAPLINRRLRAFIMRVSELLNVTAPVVVSPFGLAAEQKIPETPRGYSPYDGFKSFAQDGALSVEDIVKSLSKKRSVSRIEEETVELVTEPTAIADSSLSAAAEDGANIPVSVRGFTVALLEGDRSAVFAGLRQQVRGGGTPEQLISAAVCLLDDVYRARIDGTACDAALARVAAHLPVTTLETLISSLATAVDASYSSGMTGAKLALVRALAVLGA